MAHILIIDDDSSCLRTLYKMLESLGHSVVTTRTAITALEHLENRLALPVDAILSDYDLGGLTGLELFEIVRIRYPQLPLLLVSGHDFGRTPPPARILKKPYTLDELTAAIAPLFETNLKSLP